MLFHHNSFSMDIFETLTSPSHFLCFIEKAATFREIYPFFNNISLFLNKPSLLIVRFEVPFYFTAQQMFLCFSFLFSLFRNLCPHVIIGNVGIKTLTCLPIFSSGFPCGSGDADVLAVVTEIEQKYL